MEDSFRNVVEQQNKKYIETAQLKAVVNYVYLDAWCADVQVIGSISSILKKVPISLAIDRSDIRAGDKCKIDVFDVNNPQDCVLAYTYGRSRSQKKNGGSLNPTLSTTKIAHGLGVVPSSYALNIPGYYTAYYYISSVDADYLYISYSGSPGSQSGYSWSASVAE